MDEPFGDYLKKYREEHGRTQEEMADIMGLSIRMYVYYESGDYKGSTARIKKFKDKLASNLENQNLTIVKNGKHALPHTAKSLNIPVPQFAEAGDNLLSHFLPVYDLSNQKEILLDFTSRQDLILFYYSLPDFKDCPLAIIMVGNEMANLYKDGDKLLIDPYDKSDVIFGRPYLIFTKKFVVVRYIHTTKNEDIWLLKAENPRYDEFTINTEKIDFLFQVKGHVSRGCY
jgi:transcriptional regulator with XRE-family HTH domain